MKLAYVPERAFENHLGDVQQQSFTIAASGKAFRGLIDGLYSDKPGSITRELWSNAYDAHLAAGCPEKPFYVEVPSRMNPVFLVRDYGIGMDHETIMGLYTTMFASTKDDSNEQVGAFGLGSKTPFSYTDTFTVTTFSGTERRVYLTFIDGSGVPVISLMETAVCDDPRGVEVTFPVKREDVPQFEAAAAKVVAGFKVPPTGENVPAVSSYGDPLMSGNGWEFYKEGPSWERTGLKSHMIHQGCAIYPVANIPANGLRGWFMLTVPIGTVQVTLSRESLSMDDDTTATVKALFTQAAAEAKDQLKALVDGCKDDFERALLHQKWYQVGGLPSGLSAEVSLYKSNARDFDGTNWPLSVRAGHKDERTIISENVSTLDRVKVYVDRGEKMLRKRIRIRAATVHDRRTLVFRTDKTGLDLKTLIKIWHLKPEQVLPISTLPDTNVPARAKPVQKLKVLAPDERYVVLEDGSRSIVEFNNGRHRFEQVKDHASNLLGIRVVAYTALQVKRYKFTPEQSLDWRVAQRRRAITPDILNRVALGAVRTGYNAIDAKVYSVQSTPVVEFMEQYFHKEWYEALSDARAIMDALAGDYPLLSGGSNDASDYEEYILAIDAYRKAIADGTVSP